MFFEHETYNKRECFLARKLALIDESEGRQKARRQYKLAQEFTTGKNLKKDLAQAAYWYKESAENEYAPAQHVLSILYMFAKGVAENKCLAAYWCEKAANHGIHYAEYNFAVMLHQGFGLIKKDLPTAIYYYEQASKKGFAKASFALGIIYYREEGLSDSVENLLKAIGYLQEAVIQGHQDAERVLIKAHREYNLAMQQGTFSANGSSSRMTVSSSSSTSSRCKKK